MTDLPTYSEPLNPVQIEQEIRRLMNESAEGVRVVTARLRAYKDADRAYDAAYASAYLDCTGPAHERKYAAELATTGLRELRDVAEVAWRYAEGRARAIERNLSGFQTINRTVSQMYSAAGFAGEGG